MKTKTGLSPHNETDPHKNRRVNLSKLFALDLLKTSLKSVYTSAGINKLLLAGKERMAFRTDFNVNIAALGRSSLICGAAGTLDSYVIICGMDTFFHLSDTSWLDILAVIFQQLHYILPQPGV